MRALGCSLPLEDMEPHIRAWDRWMRALGDFYDYRDTDGVGRVYEVHRRSIHPAMRVCREWGSLLNDRTQVACAEQACTDWLAGWMTRTGFLASAQECVVRAFGLGTGAWALWVDAGSREVRVRRYDARMVVPLTWDEEGVTECAFVTRAFWRGRAVDQVQLHLRGGAGGTLFSPGESLREGAGTRSSRLTDDESEGTYRIVTACFDRDGNRVEPEGVCPVYDPGSVWPTFSIVKPAIDNTRVDMSPYGQSVFADAVDAIQAVDLCYDAMMSEIDNGKMRVFLSDVMFDVERDGKGGRVSIPFGRQDCTVFRKVMSTEDTIHEFAPTLRTEAQARAFRVALRTLGDLCGFGINYFDLENVGYVKTATEVSADNSALMRNIRRHERARGRDRGHLPRAARGRAQARRGAARRGARARDVRRQHHHGHDGGEAAGHGRGRGGPPGAVGVPGKVARRGRGDREDSRPIGAFRRRAGVTPPTGADGPRDAAARLPRRDTQPKRAVRP